MGSHPTLAHPNPTRELEDVSTQLAPQQHIAEAQPTTRELEQTFDRLNPHYGVPADHANPYGHQALRDRETALSLGAKILMLPYFSIAREVEAFAACLQSEDGQEGVAAFLEKREARWTGR